MAGLSVFAYAVLLLFGLKDLSCSANTELILPPTKYGPVAGNQGRRPSESDIINMLPKNPSFPLPSTPPSEAVSLINVLATSPYLMYSLPPTVIIKVINEVSKSPSLIRAVEPSTLAYLIGALCSSPSLLQHASGATTLIDLATAIVLIPGMENALPPPITIRLLSKIKDEASDALCSLAPAIKVQLIISACTPTALSSLKPTEIAFLVDLFSSTDCMLTETPPYVLAAVLKTIASSSALTIDICISRIVGLLYRMSLLAPTLLSVITPEIAQTLLAPFDILTINSQSPETLLQLIDVITSFPSMIDTVGPSIISSILTRLSQSSILKDASPKTIIKLLTNITLSKILKEINVDAIANILNSFATVSPLTIRNIPPSVCFEYVSLLATGPLSTKTKVKFIDTLTNNPCLLAQLSPSSIGEMISFIVSSEQILNAISSNNIICFIESVTELSPFILQDTSLDDISKLLPPRLDSLSSYSFIKLLKSIASCPFLLNAFSKDQILNIFTMMNSSSGIIQKIPSKVLIDIIIQIFTTPTLMTKIPLSVILDLLINIENQVPNVICTIPSFAISAFTGFLGNDPAKLASLLSADVTRLVYVLVKFPCILSQVSVQALNALLNEIANLDTILNALSAGTKVDLFYSIYSISPSILCSLSPESILGIVNSFNSFELLCNLSPQHLLKFTTMLSECPVILNLQTDVTLTNLLDVLSAIPSTLSAIDASVIINLVTSISSNAVLPASTYVRFLRALATVNLSLPCVVPTSVSAKLLDQLKSPDRFNELMSSDVEDLVDLLITTPGLFCELPTVVMVNTMAALAQKFTTVVPRTKIIVLLTQMNKVSSSLLCSVPEEVLAALLNTLCSQTELNALPSAYVAALATIMSSSPCMLNLMPAPAFISFLGLLSSSVEALGLIRPKTFANLLTKLVLTPSLLGRIKPSLIIPLLSTLFSTSDPSAGCALSPVLLDALLGATCDVKTIYTLEPTEVALLLNVTATVPCVLNAMPSLALDTLMSKLASSPTFFAQVLPPLTASFLAAVASSPLALHSIRPVTLIDALITIALKQPTVLSILPLSSATAILATFNTQALGSLPTPFIGGFLQLILFSPNLFIAMPLSTLDCLLRFLTSSTTALDSLSSTTLITFLTVLSSLPKLLSAISSITLTFFIASLSNLFPEILCNLPPPVVITLMGSITSNTALTTSSPLSISALISIMSRTPCLFTTLPISSLVFLITYLSAHPNLLSATTKIELIKLINRIQSPGSFSQIESGGIPFIVNRFEKHSQPRLPPLIIDQNIFSNTNPVPEILPTNNLSNQSIFTIFNNSKDSDEKNTPENSEIPKNLVPKLIYPKNFKGADIYIIPKNNNSPPSSKTALT